MGAYEGILWAGAQEGGLRDPGESVGKCRGRLERRSPVRVGQDVICLWVLDGHDDARRQDQLSPRLGQVKDVHTVGAALEHIARHPACTHGGTRFGGLRSKVGGGVRGPEEGGVKGEAPSEVHTILLHTKHPLVHIHACSGWDGSGAQ